MEVNLKLPFHCFCFLNLFILGSAGSSLLCSSLVAVSWGYSLSCCARASHCCSFFGAEHRLQGAGFSSCDSWALEHRLTCCGSWAQFLCGMRIFLDQGSNLCLLHWQADSLPLATRGTPSIQCYFKTLGSIYFGMCKAMAPHSSTLAWKIPWTEEPGGLQSMGSLRVGHD